MTNNNMDVSPCHQDPSTICTRICQHIDLIITCTYRSQAEQDELYAQGRTKPGRIVTWTRSSLHSATLADGRPGSQAFDVVPLRYGKPVWGTSGNGLDDDPTDDETDDLELWERVGTIGMSVGLEWGGNWRQKDRPHFQLFQRKQGEQ